MGDEEGTTYFSYRGPSPYDASSAGQGHRSTLRSVHSAISNRGDNDEITTLAVRPYQSSHPDMPTQSLILVSPPYPGSFHHPHYANTNGLMVPPYTPYDPVTRDNVEERHSMVNRKAHPDFTKGTENLRQCVFIMGFVFLLAFGVTIFMGVYYGTNS